MANIGAFERAEDIFRSVTLTIDGALADTSNFTTIEVRVFHKFNKVQVGSYSRVGGTVDNPAPTTSGVITFIVSRTENDDAATHIYSYEVETSEVDADFEGGTRTRKFIGDCFNLVFGNEP